MAMIRRPLNHLDPPPRASRGHRALCGAPPHPPTLPRPANLGRRLLIGMHGKHDLEKSRHRAPWTLSAALATVVLALGGCAGTQHGDEPAPFTPPPLSPVPDFEGPRADEYSRAWNESADRWVHRVLLDESITADEFTEGTDHFADCMAMYGAVVTRFTPDERVMEWPVGKPPSLTDAAEEDVCLVESGMYWVAPLADEPDE